MILGKRVVEISRGSLSKPSGFSPKLLAQKASV